MSDEQPNDSSRPTDPEAAEAQTTEAQAAEVAGLEVEALDADRPEVVAVETEVTDETVEVRRAPRYGAFLLAGGVLGAIVALILTFAFPENDQFDRGQVFGFLLLALGVIGVGVGALAALVVDRSLSRRSGRAIVEHEATHRID
ncbi:hypothetical protein [Agromyces larvae]|uniref:MFS transporter n=1 Tax=Agromyces larvae TaxID=2929802 RepID=A0ABY4BUY1_9MICO|nr:hypothetical protein [Agromyces larvae]UOE43010.1 hypothetical protein MTO99_12515 [Agromyces larvae]